MGLLFAEDEFSQWEIEVRRSVRLVIAKCKFLFEEWIRKICLKHTIIPSINLTLHLIHCICLLV